MSDDVNHPAHYGGKDSPYEVIKVAEAWEFDKDAYLFNVLKYIARPGKGNYLEDLKKAQFYLNRKIARLEAEQATAKAEKRERLMPCTDCDLFVCPTGVARCPDCENKRIGYGRDWQRYWATGEG